MARTIFATQVRMLLCERCGAPLETTIEGGAVPCAYCKATNAVRPRLDRFAPTRASALSEPERLARLRAQDHTPYKLPPSVEALAPGGSVSEARLTEAFDVFQATRQELKNTQSPEASERLYALTLVVTNTLTRLADSARVRSLLETTLDVVVLERHRNSLRAMLSRHAAREGDLDSAEQWLAGCDPRSDEISSDSDYRVSRAFIDTLRGRPDAVLEVLGRSDADVPIDDRLDLQAALLRAHAIEVKGDVEGAVRTLTDVLRAGGGAMRQGMIQTREAYAHAVSLCPKSFPTALEREVRRVTSPWRLIASLWFIMLGISAIFAFAMGANTWENYHRAVDGYGGSAAVRRAAWNDIVVHNASQLAFIVGFYSLVVVAISAGVLLWTRKRRQRLLHGRRVLARISSVTGGNLVVNGVPQVQVVLEWQDGATSRSAKMTVGAGPGVAPGGTLAVIVDPKNPSKAMLEPD